MTAIDPALAQIVKVLARAAVKRDIGQGGEDFERRMRAIKLSANFDAADLCCTGETWQRYRINNEPKEQATWAALRTLCETILEPIAQKLGRPTIAYGFASLELQKLICQGIATRVDQHASCELDRAGQPLCGRLGAAVDIRVPGICANRLGAFITSNLEFDRLYFYGPDRPLHVSIGPQRSGKVVRMVTDSTGRVMPRRSSAKGMGWI